MQTLLTEPSTSSVEILRKAPDRVARLTLLDTSARPDTPDQTQRRHAQVGLANGGRFAEIPDLLFPFLIIATTTTMRPCSGWCG